MKFVVQSAVLNKDQRDKIVEATRGYPVVYSGMQMFDRNLYPSEQIIGTDYIPLGSTLLAEIGASAGWKGCHYDLSIMNHANFNKNHSMMLNGHGHILSVTDTLEFLKTQHPDRKFFVRPSEDSKHFSGWVTDVASMIEDFTDRLECYHAGDGGSYKMAPSQEILLAIPREIVMEYRCFIVGGKLISSTVINEPLQPISKSMQNALEVMINEWIPQPCVVMDVVECTDSALYVSEFNCINSSGFYYADHKKVVDALWEYHNG